MSRSFTAGVFFVSVAIQAGWSQEARGTILGRVTDGSGAVIPGVAVKLTHVATGVSRSTVTNDQGNYSAPLLPHGAYQVAAEHEGFKRFVRDPVDLRINDRMELNITLV